MYYMNLMRIYYNTHIAVYPIFHLCKIDLLKFYYIENISRRAAEDSLSN